MSKSKDSINDSGQRQPLTESELDHTSFLPTWSESGKRNWIYPKRLHGQESKRRKKIAVFLTLFYIIAPWIQSNGIPLIRLDLANNQLSILFSVYRFTELKYLVILLSIFGVGLFFISSIRGREWCGNYCPQTVFLEWLIRPIEEFIEGRAERRQINDNKKINTPVFLKKLFKHVTFFLVAAILSHSLLGFFISPYDIIKWVQSSPVEHFNAFLLTLGITLALYFNFAYFREQFCAFVCPYARIQATMIDEFTPAIRYNSERGEPRSKRKKTVAGDCIDCGLCVRVCPMGIDIRNGNQLECIQCRRCEDACNSVMNSLGRENGLIALRGEKTEKANDRHGRLRPQIYRTILSLLVASLIISFFLRDSLQFHVTRQPGFPYATLPSGEYVNMFQFTFENNSNEEKSLMLRTMGSDKIKLICGRCEKSLGPFDSVRAPVLIISPKHLEIDSITIQHTASKRTKELTFIRPENNDL